MLCGTKLLDSHSEIYFVLLQSGEWTDYDQSLLTRAMIKFPGGTHNRWEKIAVEIGRSVEEVSQVSRRNGCGKAIGRYR